MHKTFGWCALALIIGFIAGWLLSNKNAEDTCLTMGGRWAEPGLCYDATKYLFN